MARDGARIDLGRGRSGFAGFVLPALSRRLTQPRTECRRATPMRHGFDQRQRVLVYARTRLWMYPFSNGRMLRKCAAGRELNRFAQSRAVPGSVIYLAPTSGPLQ